MHIEDLGYNSFFEKHRDQLGLSDFPVARVIAEFRNAYRVKNESGERLAKVTGRQMFRAASREDYPAVGDFVAITELGTDQAILRGVLPRTSLLKRIYGDKNRSGEKDQTQVIAANIDIAFIVESIDRDFSLNRLERYFAIATSGGVRSAIILNKIDRISKEELGDKMRQLRGRFPEIDVIATSTVRTDGAETLRRFIQKEKTYCFLGSSGVGKSSLINMLLGDKTAIKTGDISSLSGRGKHTTTGRQMYFLESGGMVIDNPGIREVGSDAAGESVDELFDDITALAQKCKYADCTHTHEPGCEVIRATERGELDRQKLSNYVTLRKEAQYHELSSSQKREKDRRFGKFVKKAKKGLKGFRHRK